MLSRNGTTRDLGCSLFIMRVGGTVWKEGVLQIIWICAPPKGRREFGDKSDTAVDPLWSTVEIDVAVYPYPEEGVLFSVKPQLRC